MSQEDWAAPWPFLSRIASMKAANPVATVATAASMTSSGSPLCAMRGGPFGGPPSVDRSAAAAGAGGDAATSGRRC